MNGLELSRLYYQQIGRPMLEEKFGEYLPRIAAGLVGEGSECFGFDDDISRDHDFGPGFCIWLCKEDFEKIGAEMQNAYNNLPKDFMGYTARNTSLRGGGRVGVFEISDFYSRFVGRKQPPEKLADWLFLPEHKIATAVNGEVFEDNFGEFRKIRTALKSYYPEDVRIKKIAARASAMAQSGQYNYARCMRRGDTVAANMALAEFVKATISMVYLLNRQYCPYYKWQFYGLKKLNKDMGHRFACSGVLNMLEKLSVTEDQSCAWQPPFAADWNPYVNKYDKKVVLMENICALIINELRNQGLTDIDDTFLEAHTYKIMDKIADSELRHFYVTEG
ncbi:MAG: DUF4037 domain-containing protein [Oscillospiraceae bacterium]|nr:DUF4037 domain-containing protein [Oscillospiraceae bacterium]